MPTLPSIKGSVFCAAVEDIQKLVSTGKLKPEELTRWLKPKDLGYLQAPVQPFEWYDIRSYARMGALLRDVEGRGSNEYLKQRGAKNARRLLDAGLYQQLEYTKSTSFVRQSDKRARSEAFGRDLLRLVTLQASILNFSRIEVKSDPEHPLRWTMETLQAKEYPDTLCWSTEGLINEMARQHGTPDLWTWTRPEPDRIVWRMTRDI